MKTIRLTYKVKSLAGDFDTSVECDFLNDDKSFLEVTDLIKKDLTTYNAFIDELASVYMTDYIDSSVNEEGLTITTIRVNDWKLTGIYDELSDNDKFKYDHFYILLENNKL